MLLLCVKICDMNDLFQIFHFNVVEMTNDLCIFLVYNITISFNFKIGFIFLYDSMIFWWTRIIKKWVDRLCLLFIMSTCLYNMVQKVIYKYKYCDRQALSHQDHMLCGCHQAGYQMFIIIIWPGEFFYRWYSIFYQVWNWSYLGYK